MATRPKPLSLSIGEFKLRTPLPSRETIKKFAQALPWLALIAQPYLHIMASPVPPPSTSSQVTAPASQSIGSSH